MYNYMYNVDEFTIYIFILNILCIGSYIYIYIYILYICIYSYRYANKYMI